MGNTKELVKDRLNELSELAEACSNQLKKVNEELTKAKKLFDELLTLPLEKQIERFSK